MKKSKTKAALAALYTGSFLTSIAPVVTVIAVNWSDYVSTPSRAVSLASGGAIALIVLGMQILGKTPKNLHRLVKYAFVTVACWAVYNIIDQLCLLVTCAFGGELASFMAFTVPIDKFKEKLNGEKIVAVVKEEETLSGRV
ncbi:MAG: hypothetical protein IJS93_03395 [Clostridia bacterium]|nr:hypothetical protein [Clostridia bacterium]